MGLDNGIRIKINKIEGKLPWFVELEPSFNGKEIEVCYWRKCWGIRDEILKLCHFENQYYYELESEDIPAIIRVLGNFMDREYWNERADSIWTYDEYLPQNTHNILNLLWLKDYMDEHPEVECYFYDSY